MLDLFYEPLSANQLLDIAKETIPRYIDTAKTFAQISAAALTLTVIFREKILGNTGRVPRDYWLFGAWLFFLLSIGASATYQWAGVKWIDYRMQAVTTPNLAAAFPNSFGGPHIFFGAMLIFFMIGAVLLMISSTRQLFSS